jgi:hypothetical protein
MTIVKRRARRGRTRYQARVWRDGRKVTLGTFDRERDAKRALRDALADAHPPGPSCADFAREWLQQGCPRVSGRQLKADTLHSYRLALEGFIEGLRGNRDHRREQGAGVRLGAREPLARPVRHGALQPRQGHRVGPGQPLRGITSGALRRPPEPRAAERGGAAQAGGGRRRHGCLGTDLPWPDPLPRLHGHAARRGLRAQVGRHRPQAEDDPRPSSGRPRRRGGPAEVEPHPHHPLAPTRRGRAGVDAALHGPGLPRCPREAAQALKRRVPLAQARHRPRPLRPAPLRRPPHVRDARAARPGGGSAARPSRRRPARGDALRTWRPRRAR